VPALGGVEFLLLVLLTPLVLFAIIYFAVRLGSQAGRRR
jgi:hypothetical protein